MRILHNICIFDTETIGRMTAPLIHNYGHVILDRNLDIVRACDRRVSEFHFQHPELLEASEFYVAHRIADTVPARKFKNVLNMLISDCKQNKVKVLAAYNVAFDIRALRSTAKFFGCEEELEKFLKKVKIVDILKLARETVCREMGYKQYVYSVPNGVSEKTGKPRTTAELVYGYISNNPNFKEDHTALSDCRIEAEILQYILRTYKGNMKYYEIKEKGAN